MRLNHRYDLRDMLGAAGATVSGSGGSGRSELFGRLGSIKTRLPGSVQRRLPSDVPSGLLFVAYAATAFVALGGIVQAVGKADAVPVIFIGAFYVAAGLAGLWFGSNLFVVVPATLLWLLAAQASLFSSRPNYSWALAFGGCSAVGLLVGIRSVMRDRANVRRSSRASDAATNQLGWDLYKLSTDAPPTDERLSGIAVYPDLRLGELQRHFDQTTSAAIQGGMEHAFRLQGWTQELHNLPGGWFDTASHTSLGRRGRVERPTGDDRHCRR
jgi:hypothetical protein